jgi:hypothetical protein
MCPDRLNWANEVARAYILTNPGFIAVLVCVLCLQKQIKQLNRQLSGLLAERDRIPYSSPDYGSSTSSSGSVNGAADGSYSSSTSSSSSGNSTNGGRYTDTSYSPPPKSDSTTSSSSSSYRRDKDKWDAMQVEDELQKLKKKMGFK